MPIISKNQFFIVVLYSLEAMTRGLLLTLVPLQLLDKLGTAQNVTYVYSVVGLFALGNSVFVPFLIARLSIRPVIAIGGILEIIAAVLLALDPVLCKTLGLAVRAIGTSCIEIPLVALIMQGIPRDRLGAFEPFRIVIAGVCMAISPWVGFQLYEKVAIYAPNTVAVTGGILITLIALLSLPRDLPGMSFKSVRLGSAAFRRFLSQPRLCVAWILAVVRTSFWSIFFIYAPIFGVMCGWAASSASMLVSAGLATMIFVPLWGRLVRRFGIRPMLILGYALTGASLLLAALVAKIDPGFAPVLLFIAALSASIVDGAGNVPFLRASRAHDRTAMAGVYMTFRDTGQFSPIALFAAIMLAFELTTAFTVAAAVLFGASFLSRTIHPRLN